MSGRDVREIEHLIHRYAECIDAGDFEGVGELFAHGRIEAATDAVFEGRERVIGLYRRSVRLYPDGLPHTRHVNTNAIVEIDAGGSRAASRSTYTVFQQVDDLPLQAIVCGRYHDSFRRREDRWWFDTRTIHVDLTGDLSRHLLFELD